MLTKYLENVRTLREQCMTVEDKDDFYKGEEDCILVSYTAIWLLKIRCPTSLCDRRSIAVIKSTQNGLLM